MPLPAIDGLGAGDEAITGLVISHGHPDHYGLAEQVHPSVPVFIGEASARILNEARFFGAAGAALKPGGYLRDREPLDLDPYRVTPYLITAPSTPTHCSLRLAVAVSSTRGTSALMDERRVVSRRSCASRQRMSTCCSWRART